ncbi:MAG: hypothetical protein COV29_00400 [Candidatus Yanofskybacteria bacterium CG10_big_fil_rev_8_21_14_0_10_36_16]|uniref:Uncharacterized protein n=1 Tax=Candidatus Yanofskybacteria bacterium CG10_big_fil_rev_8_21_14_0_10_36_16 TaxID=1975096 RepID=A0A2J0Q8P1_9BACT|nr:MAG: hypothetical protein COV29_00400 [Candidatus Yanofskybacteria bacterium CG10_big_fil_rev_8_21_14_0_10_36_16]
MDFNTSQQSQNQEPLLHPSQTPIGADIHKIKLEAFLLILSSLVIAWLGFSYLNNYWPFSSPFNNDYNAPKIGESEIDSQVFSVAQDCVKKATAEDLEFYIDSKPISQSENYITLRVVPLNKEAGDSSVTLEKTNKEWTCKGYNQPNTDTASWQTYRNEEFGFEVKYPEDWEIDVSDFESGRNTKYEKEFNISPVYNVPSLSCLYVDSQLGGSFNFKIKGTEENNFIRLEFSFLDYNLYPQVYLTSAYDFNPDSAEDFNKVNTIKFAEDIRNKVKKYTSLKREEEFVPMLNGMARHFPPFGDTTPCDVSYIEGYEIVSGNWLVFITIYQTGTYDIDISNPKSIYQKDLIDQIISTFRFLEPTSTLIRDIGNSDIPEIVKTLCRQNNEYTFSDKQNKEHLFRGGSQNASFCMEGEEAII